MFICILFTTIKILQYVYYYFHNLAVDNTQFATQNTSLDPHTMTSLFMAVAIPAAAKICFQTVTICVI